jgi:UDP-glucose 4-epimerase
MSLALVTGGAGFIGSHVVRALLADGLQVRVLDDLSTGSHENLDGLPVDLRTADVLEAEAVRAAARGADHIVHLAAMISVPASLDNPAGCYRTNVVGSLNVLEAARQENVRRVVLASSCAVYGDHIGAVAENAEVRPLSPYASSKWGMEDAARLYRNAFGLETACLRLFNVYGPRQDVASPYAAVIPIFAREMLAGRAVTIHGDGHQSRDFVYVEDVARAFRLAADAPQISGVFNIGAGQSVTILQLVEALRRLIPGAGEPTFAAPRPGDIRTSAADIGLARNSFGYRPAWDLHKGLAATVEWTRASRSIAPV